MQPCDSARRIFQHSRWPVSLLDSLKHHIDRQANHVLSALPVVVVCRWSTIGGGANNNVYASYASILGGQLSAVYAPLGSVCGGARNYVYGYAAAVGGGRYNSAQSSYATIGGGQYNYVYSSTAVVAGGGYNFVYGYAATVGGGYDNRAYGSWSSVSGGNKNYAYGAWSVVNGGYNNFAYGGWSVVSGGSYNYAYSSWSTVGGGYYCRAGRSYGTVGGGYYNYNYGYAATIGGGHSNYVYISYASIGGGHRQYIYGYAATIAGGMYNSAYGSWSAVGGGYYCRVMTTYGTVGGGYYNNNYGYAATIGGGYYNNIYAYAATVGGGIYNHNYGYAATIGGGYKHYVYAYAATIAGGMYNSAYGSWSTVGGGYYCRVGAAYGTVGGGYYNNNYGYAATIGGGYYNNNYGYAATIGGGYYTNIYASYSTVGGGAYVYVYSGYSTVSGGAYHYTYSYGATIAGGTYNQVRAQWGSIGGGYNSHIYGQGASIGGGYANTIYGPYSTVSGGYEDLAYGYASTIGGGSYNTAAATWSCVGGGYNNKVYDQGSCVGGGENNIIYSSSATVGGGAQNIVGADFAAIIGGRFNFANGSDAVVAGGSYNSVLGEAASVGGGNANEAEGAFAVVGGGEGNAAVGNWSSVSGGFLNSAMGLYSLAQGRNTFVEHDFAAALGFSSQNQTCRSHSRSSISMCAENGLFLNGERLDTAVQQNTLDLETQAERIGSVQANVSLQQSLLNSLQDTLATQRANISALSDSTSRNAAAIRLLPSNESVTRTFALLQDRLDINVEAIKVVNASITQHLATQQKTVDDLELSTGQLHAVDEQLRNNISTLQEGLNVTSARLNELDVDENSARLKRLNRDVNFLDANLSSLGGLVAEVTGTVREVNESLVTLQALDIAVVQSNISAAGHAIQELQNHDMLQDDIIQSLQWNATTSAEAAAALHMDVQLLANDLTDHGFGLDVAFDLTDSLNASLLTQQRLLTSLDELVVDLTDSVDSVNESLSALQSRDVAILQRNVSETQQFAIALGVQLEMQHETVVDLTSNVSALTDVTSIANNNIELLQIDLAGHGVELDKHSADISVLNESLSNQYLFTHALQTRVDEELDVLINQTQSHSSLIRRLTRNATRQDLEITELHEQVSVQATSAQMAADELELWTGRLHATDEQLRFNISTLWESLNVTSARIDELDVDENAVRLQKLSQDVDFLEDNLTSLDGLVVEVTGTVREVNESLIALQRLDIAVVQSNISAAGHAIQELQQHDKLQDDIIESLQWNATSLAAAAAALQRDNQLLANDLMEHAVRLEVALGLTDNLNASLLTQQQLLTTFDNALDVLKNQTQSHASLAQSFIRNATRQDLEITELREQVVDHATSAQMLIGNLTKTAEAQAVAIEMLNATTADQQRHILDLSANIERQDSFMEVLNSTTVDQRSKVETQAAQIQWLNASNRDQSSLLEMQSAQIQALNATNLHQSATIDLLHSTTVDQALTIETQTAKIATLNTTSFEQQRQISTQATTIHLQSEQIAELQSSVGVLNHSLASIMLTLEQMTKSTTFARVEETTHPATTASSIATTPCGIDAIVGPCSVTDEGSNVSTEPAPPIGPTTESATGSTAASTTGPTAASAILNTTSRYRGPTVTLTTCYAYPCEGQIASQIAWDRELLLIADVAFDAHGDTEGESDANVQVDGFHFALMSGDSVVWEVVQQSSLASFVPSSIDVNSFGVYELRATATLTLANTSTTEAVIPGLRFMAPPSLESIQVHVETSLNSLNAPHSFGASNMSNSSATSAALTWARVVVNATDSTPLTYDFWVHDSQSTWKYLAASENASSVHLAVPSTRDVVVEVVVTNAYGSSTSCDSSCPLLEVANATAETANVFEAVMHLEVLESFQAAEVATAALLAGIDAAHDHDDDDEGDDELSMLFASFLQLVDAQKTSAAMNVLLLYEFWTAGYSTEFLGAIEAVGSQLDGLSDSMLALYLEIVDDYSVAMQEMDDVLDEVADLDRYLSSACLTSQSGTLPDGSASTFDETLYTVSCASTETTVSLEVGAATLTTSVAGLSTVTVSQWNATALRLNSSDDTVLLSSVHGFHITGLSNGSMEYPESIPEAVDADDGHSLKIQVSNFQSDAVDASGSGNETAPSSGADASASKVVLRTSVSCKYFDETDSAWSERGIVLTGLSLEPDGTVYAICSSSHFTLFSLADDSEASNVVQQKFTSLALRVDDMNNVDLLAPDAVVNWSLFASVVSFACVSLVLIVMAKLCGRTAAVAKGKLVFQQEGRLSKPSVIGSREYEAILRKWVSGTQALKLLVMEVLTSNAVIGLLFCWDHEAIVFGRADKAMVLFSAVLMTCVASAFLFDPTESASDDAMLNVWSALVTAMLTNVLLLPVQHFLPYMVSNVNSVSSFTPLPLPLLKKEMRRLSCWKPTPRKPTKAAVTARIVEHWIGLVVDRHVSTAAAASTVAPRAGKAMPAQKTVRELTDGLQGTGQGSCNETETTNNEDAAANELMSTKLRFFCCTVESPLDSAVAAQSRRRKSPALHASRYKNADLQPNVLRGFARFQRRFLRTVRVNRAVRGVEFHAWYRHLRRDRHVLATLSAFVLLVLTASTLAVCLLLSGTFNEAETWMWMSDVGQSFVVQVFVTDPAITLAVVVLKMLVSWVLLHSGKKRMKQELQTKRAAMDTVRGRVEHKANVAVARAKALRMVVRAAHTHKNNVAPKVQAKIQTKIQNAFKTHVQAKHEKEKQLQSILASKQRLAAQARKRATKLREHHEDHGHHVEQCRIQTQDLHERETRTRNSLETIEAILKVLGNSRTASEQDLVDTEAQVAGLQRRLAHFSRARQNLLRRELKLSDKRPDTQTSVLKKSSIVPIHSVAADDLDEEPDAERTTIATANMAHGVAAAQRSAAFGPRRRSRIAPVVRKGARRRRRKIKASEVSSSLERQKTLNLKGALSLQQPSQQRLARGKMTWAQIQELQASLRAKAAAEAAEAAAAGIHGNKTATKRPKRRVMRRLSHAAIKAILERRERRRVLLQAKAAVKSGGVANV